MDSTSTTGAGDVFRLLDDLPPLPNLAQWILKLSYNDTNIADFSVAIEMNPPLAARILRLANSAYFGRKNAGIRTIYDAIYKVLGLKLVKHLALGILMCGHFRPENCKPFNLDRYWFTSIGTGIFAQNLFLLLPPYMRGTMENIYLNGLLHNIGLLALAHNFPKEMSSILSERDAAHSLDEFTRKVLGIDHLQAGGMLAEKWHLPRDVIATVRHHSDADYRDCFWPVVLLVGSCARQTNNLFWDTDADAGDGTDVFSMLGFGSDVIGKSRSVIMDQIQEIKEMAAILANDV